MFPSDKEPIKMDLWHFWSWFGTQNYKNSTAWAISVDSLVCQDGFKMNKVYMVCRIEAWTTKKTLITFHYTGWLVGILILVYYNPYIAG